jgi:hypothetical protein
MFSPTFMKETNMFIRPLLICLLFLPSFFTFCSAQEEAAKEQMLQELENVKYNFLIKYAPAEWKREFLGWSVEDAFEKAKVRLLSENLTTFRDYHKIFREFMSSPRDYHVGFQFYSTEGSFFPWSAKRVQGKYYVLPDFVLQINLEDVLFETDKLTALYDLESLAAKLKIGDELIAFNGVPIQETIERIIDEDLGGDRSLTGYALAERMLFSYWGKSGREVPLDSFEVTLLHRGERKAIVYRLPWFHIPEWVVNPLLSKREVYSSPLSEKKLQLAVADPKTTTSAIQSLHDLEALLKKDFLVEMAADLLQPKVAQSFLKHNAEEKEDEREKGFLPPLGPVVWETPLESEIYAYLFENACGERIGYLYLPSFAYEENAQKMIDQLGEIVSHLNKESQALVLDITNNPGGSLFYMYGVLSLLTDRPLTVPAQREILIPRDVYNMAVLYNFLNLVTQTSTENPEPALKELNLGGCILDLNDIQQLMVYAQSIMDMWKTGQKYTPAQFIYGVSSIKPHAAHRYDKPILLLINELDFSCGDLFPAILQDNRRAKLFGTKTAGAGGYVLPYLHTSQFGIKAYSLTGSMAYRPDGRPLENLGVSPDVKYELTVRDIQHQYAEYIRAVNAEIRKIIRG